MFPWFSPSPVSEAQSQLRSAGVRQTPVPLAEAADAVRFTLTQAQK